jgi:RNA polymerase sigma-70 factor (ECF subfamily)
VAAGQRRRAHHRREFVTSELDDHPAEGPASNPEALFFRRESRERLERALGALNLEKRAVLVMFELEGLSTPEIAAILGVPVGTVHSRLSAARAEFVRAVERLARREGSDS